MGEQSKDEFIVIDTERGGYVESIDQYDGDIEITRDPFQAWIFRGPTWRDFWFSPRYLHSEPAREVMRCIKDIES
jgi:hypothetical protein